MEVKHKEKNYITPVGLKRLQDEYDQLVRVERPEVTKVVAWAASNGDRSENADYLYGKKRLREIDRRSRFLSRRIECAVVVDPKNIKNEKIQFGASVVLEDEEGAQKSITIVGVDEIDTKKNRISWRSPLGSSLIGFQVGDTIDVRVPQGTISYDIIEVVYVEII
jgi:transcription elongation factor GreB